MVTLVSTYLSCIGRPVQRSFFVGYGNLDNRPTHCQHGNIRRKLSVYTQKLFDTFQQLDAKSIIL